MQNNKGTTYSYSSLRKAVGWIGLLLPFVLMAGILMMGETIPASISRMYHTRMVVGLVGSLCAVGFFLFFYDSYGKQDNILMKIASVSAILIAVFPTNIPGESIGVVGVIHYIVSAVFFLDLAYISYFRFTKSNKTVRKHLPKYKRNRIYKASGIVILLGIISIVIQNIFNLTDYVTLIAEIIMLIAFGISWLTKGEMIYKDHGNSTVRKRLDIIIDFDGTCTAHNEPGVGADVGAANVLRELVNAGHNLILSTMRSNSEKSLKTFGIKRGLDPAVNWFKTNKIPLYGIQAHPDQHEWTTSPKAYGQLIIDDIAWGIPLKFDKEISNRKFVDWVELRKQLKENNII